MTIHLLASIKETNGKDLNNYKSRLAEFCAKNGLSKTFGFKFLEIKHIMIVYCKLPNMSLAKRVCRIIKLIAHYRKHKWEITTMSGEMDKKEISEMMQDAVGKLQKTID
jgi:hypothetical protein